MMPCLDGQNDRRLGRLFLRVVLLERQAHEQQTTDYEHEHDYDYEEVGLIVAGRCPWLAIICRGKQKREGGHKVETS
jgi:hypothetical protein